ncbi:hypothetical protein H072_10579 [Dactylellina haptotyla CBS 200.50]|uniref:Extracellular membrane protein CFEM domain-containing protein n=1 Tax=Dactylellina haptotyla (strain CBS 200.50) TaxID=1284197 RepID=S8A4B6_DACHA|nr:hypothetical protein H072_10579 [Dactylellina haptotyla CBS 200.50]
MDRIIAVSVLLSLSMLARASSDFVQQPLKSLPATITAAPDLKYARGLYPRQQAGQYACQWVSTVFKQCSDAGYFKVGGISGLPYCACYPETFYNPNEVDGYISQCYNYAGTDAAFASQFTPFIGLCRSAGDIRGTISQEYTACSYASSVQSACSAQGFNKAAGPSQLAICACYSSTIYHPELFDGLYSTCFSYAQQADTSLASAIWPYQGFCSKAGDVRQEITSGNSLCSSIGNVIRSCSQWNQFITGDPVEQASFFCYDANTNYIGSSRDRSAQQCYTFATEFWPAMVNTVSSLQFLCSQVGDVRALYPGGNSGGGGGGSGGSGDDGGVPSPQPTTSITSPTSTRSSGGSNSNPGSGSDGPNTPDAAPKVHLHPHCYTNCIAKWPLC